MFTFSHLKHYTMNNISYLFIKFEHHEITTTNSKILHHTFLPFLL